MENFEIAPFDALALAQQCDEHWHGNTVLKCARCVCIGVAEGLDRLRPFLLTPTLLRWSNNAGSIEITRLLISDAAHGTSLASLWNRFHGWRKKSTISSMALRT